MATHTARTSQPLNQDPVSNFPCPVSLLQPLGHKSLVTGMKSEWRVASAGRGALQEAPAQPLWLADGPDSGRPLPRD